MWWSQNKKKSRGLYWFPICRGFSAYSADREAEKCGKGNWQRINSHTLQMLLTLCSTNLIFGHIKLNPLHFDITFPSFIPFFLPFIPSFLTSSSSSPSLFPSPLPSFLCSFPHCLWLFLTPLEIKSRSFTMSYIPSPLLLLCGDGVFLISLGWTGIGCPHTLALR